jgi:hypothetical protein
MVLRLIAAPSTISGIRAGWVVELWGAGSATWFAASGLATGVGIT